MTGRESGMYIFYNPNPTGQFVGDCVIRAIAKATGQSWDDAYFHVAMQGYIEKNMPSANRVWGNYLKSIGFSKYTINANHTINQFAQENAGGVFVLGTGAHVVTVVDGDYYDAWDSGNEIPIYFFRR